MQKLSMHQLGRPSAEAYREASKLPLVVVLDQVRSMHNVGSVFRSADAFKAGHIYLCGFTPTPPHRDIHKTALGATETVAWSYAPNTLDVLKELKAQGYRILAIEQTTQSTPLQHSMWDGQQPIALVFGNEVEGVQQAAIDLCDGAVEIPQAGAKHSLNISVAAGIVLYHFFLQGIEAETRL